MLKINMDKKRKDNELKQSAHGLIKTQRALFVFFILSHASFFNIGEWNQSSRYDAIFSTVEHIEKPLPLFAIDPFLSHPEMNFNTGDWAHNDGHYYSNKAPGTIIIGALIYAGLYFIEDVLLKSNPKEIAFTLFNMWFINLMLTILPLAFATLLLFKMTYHISTSLRSAFLCATTFGWCTLIWPYSSSLWGHPNAVAALVIGTYLFWKSHRRYASWIGFCGGLAVLLDYSSIICLCVLLLALTFKKEWLTLAHIIKGGLFPALIYMFYHKYCFDSFFLTAAHFSNPAFLDQNHTGGLLQLPQIGVLFSILFSKQIGLFTLMPVMLFMPFGYICALRGKKNLEFMYIGIAVIISMLFFHMSFNGWYGGNVMGGRYQIIALPFWLFGFFYLKIAKPWRYLLYLATAISGLNMLIINSVSTVYRPEKLPYTIFDYYALFFDGHLVKWTAPLRLSIPNTPTLQKYAHFNLGELMGLHGLATLTPFFILCLLTFYFICRLLKSENIHHDG